MGPVNHFLALKNQLRSVPIVADMSAPRTQTVMLTVAIFFPIRQRTCCHDPYGNRSVIKACGRDRRGSRKAKDDSDEGRPQTCSQCNWPASSSKIEGAFLELSVVNEANSHRDHLR